jgi:hypothetical protein
MSRISQTGLATHKTPAPVAAGAKHFDTFETKFFEQGEAGDGERFEELYDTHPSKRALYRTFLIGVAVGGISMAFLGGVGLWLFGARFGEPRVADSAEPATLPAPPTAAPSPVPAVAPAEPVPAQPAVAAHDNPAAAPAAIPVVNDEPKPAVAAAPAVAEKPALVLAEKPAAAAAPAPAPPVEAPVEKPTVGAAGLGPLPVPTANADASSARCTKAIDGKRSKDILASCPAAFAADPSAAGIAVALARVEFDRGRSAKALEWGRKAIAVDPNAADAYVFVGAGEQMAGHDKAAKDAYRRYLELAPSGRYARDVRSMVGSAK